MNELQKRIQEGLNPGWAAVRAGLLAGPRIETELVQRIEDHFSGRALRREIEARERAWLKAITGGGC